MPLQRSRRPSRELAPAERLTRAIGNIDKHLGEAAAREQPIPLSAHRARRILQDALQRCEEPAAYRSPSSSFDGSSQAGVLLKTLRPHGGLVERHRQLPSLLSTVCESPDLTLAQHRPTAKLPPRDDDRDPQAPHDKTAEAARKRNRRTLASIVFLNVVTLLGITAVMAKFV